MHSALVSAALLGLAAAGLAAGAAAVEPPAGRVPAPGPARAAGVAPTSTSAEPFALPLAGSPAVVHPFVAPAAPWSPGHRGVDLAALAGDVVLAPASGIVAFAGTVVDRGVITVTHADGLRSSLEPVAPTVSAGTHVAPGHAIGTVQDVAGHCDPATCLHWGVRRGDTYLDPLDLLAGAGPVVLLPGP